MPQEAWNAKRERQYKHIKEGLRERGTSEDKAEEIAARTVNKERARSGEARESSRLSRKDISSGRRGGLSLGHEPAQGPDEGAALQRGQGSGHRRALEDEQAAAPTSGGPEEVSGSARSVEHRGSVTMLAA